jgi:hypothetical protein
VCKGDLMFSCPVCLYSEMPDPPRDYHICPCCGTEFGNDDADCTYDQLRDRWIRAGAPWFFGSPPYGWSPQAQLLRGSLAAETNAGVTQSKENAMAAAVGAGASSFGHVWENLSTTEQLGSGSVFNPLFASIAGQQSALGEL